MIGHRPAGFGPARVLMAVFAIAACVVVLPVRTAAAASGPSITLVSQPAWVDSTAPTIVTVSVANAPSGARLHQMLHTGTVTQRTELHNLGAGRTPSNTVADVVDTPVPNGSTVTMPVTVRLSVFGAANRLTDSYQGRDGIYPLELSLLDSRGRSVGASLITPLLLPPASNSTSTTPSSIPSGLAVALVAPVGNKPTISANGQRNLSGGQRNAVASMLAALAGQPGSYNGAPYPVTFAAVPDTVDAIAADKALQTLQTTLIAAAGAANRQVLASPYVPVDQPAMLTDPRLAGLLDQMVTDGLSSLRNHLNPQTTTLTWLADPDLDAATLDRLRQYSVQNLLIPAAALSTTRTTLPATAPFKLSDDPTGSMRATAVDADLQSELGMSDGRLGVQQALADLWLIDKSTTNPAGAGIALVAPQSWSPSTATLQALLDGLSKMPSILRPVTVNDLFAEAASTTTASRRLVGRPVTPTRYISSLAQSDAVVGAYQSAIAPKTQPISPAAKQRLDALGLRREVSAYRGFDVSVQQRYLDQINGAARGDLGRVTLPADQKVTITARTAKVPLTIRNGTGLPVTVQVVAEGSERVKLEAGALQTVTLAGETTPIDLHVHVRTSGDIPIRLKLLTPNGQAQIATSQVTVRSTAVSGVGLFLTIGALAFLLLWWARHWRRNRKPPRGRHARPRGHAARVE